MIDKPPTTKRKEKHAGLKKETSPRAGGFATLLLAGFLVVAVRADFPHDAFFIQFFLKTAQRAIDGLATFDFHFSDDVIFHGFLFGFLLRDSCRFERVKKYRFVPAMSNAR